MEKNGASFVMSILASWCSLRVYKLRNKLVLSKKKNLENYLTWWSCWVESVSLKFVQTIFFFDLNFHSKAYRKTWHSVSGFLLLSFLYLSTICTQTLMKSHSHKKFQSTQFSTTSISKYGFYLYNNEYWKNAIWTT